MKTTLLIILTLISLLFSSCTGEKDAKIEELIKKVEELKKENQKLLQEKKLELSEKCSLTGKIYFDDFIRRNLPEGFLWDEPEYHYSTKLNTCLIHIRYVSQGPYIFSHRNQIIDIFANKPILYGCFERDRDKKTETLSEIVCDNAPNYASI